MSEDFYDAAVFGDMAKLKSMLAIDPDLVKSMGEYGFTALHGVASEEHYGAATYLIDNGADVNAKNDEGIAPLHLAAWPQMVELLISRGAEIDVRDESGRTPLMVHAEEAEDCDVMEMLLRLGADALAADEDGDTALSIAKERQEPDKIKILESHQRK
ncbi:MAG: ankyrin repeat domain-containing protein [Fuerstiella sp.]